MADKDFKKKNRPQLNRLISEKSPYLLQHAQNLVDWYPWNKEAFDRARKENKPIFLSIGYSTCHWCHVMAHESFENPGVARLMNDTFICIKVDREERPDIDKVYMAVCQMMTGSGGWPLTIMMTPDKVPFFAGTYIPQKSRFGLTGLLELIPQIKRLWTDHSEKLNLYAGEIKGTLQRSEMGTHTESLDVAVLDQTYQLLEQDFDPHSGGFGSAPKFPVAHHILFLLRYWRRTGHDESLHMVEKTLQAMHSGGIYDHIGFGFHRYATDPKWLVPHFEKMLYDQALLSQAYTEAFQATRHGAYAKTSYEILSYVLRDMTSAEGGFYSAEDADSEGEEGKFYLWDLLEIQKILGPEDASLINTIFHVSPDGNFQKGGMGRKTGKNIFHRTGSTDEIASEMGMPLEVLKERLENARQKLFDVREKRVHPHKDDKILTDWNGLMLAALAKAGEVLGEPRYIEVATRAVHFILQKMCGDNGQLFHRYRDGQVAIPGFLDDYAFLVWGLLALFESTFEVFYLKSALRLHQILEKHFWDQTRGGFYFTPDYAEDLLVRQKALYDGAIPSGNSVSMLNLLKLGHITGDSRFLDMAALMKRAFSKKLMEAPNGYTQYMVAMDFEFGPSYEIVVAGHSGTEDTQEMLSAIRRHFIPNKTIIFRPTEEASPEIDAISPFIKNFKRIQDKTTAYVCTNYSCTEPTTDIRKLLEILGATVNIRGVECASRDEKPYEDSYDDRKDG